MSRLKQTALYLDRVIVADPLFPLTSAPTATTEAVSAYLGMPQREGVDRRHLGAMAGCESARMLAWIRRYWLFCRARRSLSSNARSMDSFHFVFRNQSCRDMPVTPWPLSPKLSGSPRRPLLSHSLSSQPEGASRCSSTRRRTTSHNGCFAVVSEPSMSVPIARSRLFAIDVGLKLLRKQDVRGDCPLMLIDVEGFVSIPTQWWQAASQKHHRDPRHATNLIDNASRHDVQQFIRQCAHCAVIKSMV